MEQVFLVEGDYLREVNQYLQKGGRVKMIQPVAEPVSSYGYAGGETSDSIDGCNTGRIYAYVVIEFD